MADDLKPNLTKVLASKGEKKFFFAYAAGKRKDGKGDGELAVAGKKPKKADIESELADCKQVFEGVCWTGKGPDNSDTVYFQGKSTKLSGTVIAKMALTARRVAGRQYDFQVPSPEEEARAANLKEGEGGNEAAAAEAATDNLELAYQARVKALTDDLKKAITSGTAAGNEAKLRFSESQLFSRKKDFAQAQALLKVVEEQIQLALAGTGADPTAKAAPAADPAGEWKKKYADWLPAIKTAMAAKGPNAAAIAKLLAQATALSKPGGDMAQALAKLTECHDLATGSAADGASKGAESAAKAPADGDLAAQWKTKLAQWSPAIKKAMTDKGPNAAAIGKLLAQATALSKPGGDMAQALAKLTECHALATGRTIEGEVQRADSPEKAPGDAALAAEWKKNLDAWSPALKAAIQAKGPNAAAIGKRLAQAMALAKPGGDIAAAIAKLAECHALLQPPQAPTTTLSSGPSLVVLQQCRLAWETARKKVESEISSFQDLLRNKSKGDIAADVAARVASLYDSVRTAFDSTLTDTLDEALNAADPAERAAINRRAGAMVTEYRTFVDGDPHLAHLRNNPFMKLPSLAGLDSALKVLAAKLSA